MTLPLEKELHETLHHELWLLAQARLSDPLPPGESAMHVPPAHHYLSLVRESLQKCQDAMKIAKEEIPASCQWKLTNESRKCADSVEAVARQEPEVRRFWLLMSLSYILEQGLAYLEEEGKPDNAHPLNIKLAKTKRMS